MNEYALDLFCAIGSIGDDLIYDAEPKKKHGFIKFASIAACVCLAIVGAFWTLARFDFALGAKCSGSPGTTVGGAYWFHMDGKASTDTRTAKPNLYCTHSSRTAG